MGKQHRIRDERGAIIIHVAFALLTLIVFSSLVIDSGVMWVSRRQAQNAADAGALAGALGMIYQGTEARGRDAAIHFTSNMAVWGQGNSAANVRVDFSHAGFALPPCGEEPGCVRVDVFRNVRDRETRSGAILGNPLPTYFLNMVGMAEQGVRATATAEVTAGTSINCLLPFAVIDRWADNYDENPTNQYYANDPLPGIPGWSPNDKFQKNSASGLPAGQNPDVYIGPYDGNNNHTGWTVYGRPALGVAPDYGRQLIIKDGDIGNYSTGWAQRVDLVNSTGANDYNWNILNCNLTPIGIATASEPCAPAPGGSTTGREINGCISITDGMAQGPTVQNGINVLVDNDPYLRWNPNLTITNPLGGTLQGAIQNTSTGAIQMAGSMRIRPIVVFDINHYIDSGCNGTTCIGKIANIIGFFIEGRCAAVAAAGQLEPGNQCENPNKDIVGRIVTIPGQYVAGTGEVADGAAFIETVRLVR